MKPSHKNSDNAMVGGQTDLSQGYATSRPRMPEAGVAGTGRKVRGAGSRARGIASLAGGNTVPAK